MFRKRKIILIHLAVFILLTLLLLFTSEPLLNKFATGIHNVGMWIDLMIFETIIILILTIISCLIFLNKGKKRQRTEKIELTENGFLVNYNDEITQFQWSDIERLTGFKVDRITVDDICLKIESINKSAIATEEFQGWRDFMNKMLIEFPQIEKNWEGIIAKPAFERKETELYNRNKNVG
ncbi:MAG: hypothetical protein Q7W45_14065 [Bacteroidota bacterium]|nr:hypothetical protein [Bacteroidota bacterium]MDP3217602.1 hypothetical protein [Deltaproteobacteria bacterium]